MPVPVLVLYGLWIFMNFGPGHDPRDAIFIGREYITRSHISSVIRLDPSYRYPAGESGYDGEFVYFIALDPVDARYYIDSPSYRYTRIVYPMLARVLALGQPSLIPWTLLIVNWLAITGGTLCLSLWLRRKREWPWLALAYGFFPGIFFTLQRDTTEALAYGLVALAIFLFDFGGRRRTLWATIAFAVAALTRETTVIFPVLLGLALLVNERGQRQKGFFMIGATVVPLMLYKVFLLAWLGTQGDPGLLLEAVPFAGLIAARASHDWLQEVWLILVPAVICSAAAIATVARRVRLVEPWILLANVVLFVVLLSRTSYVDVYSSTRVTTGVVLAAVLALPAVGAVIGTRLWFWFSGAIWLSAMPSALLIPEARWLAHTVFRRSSH